MELLKLLEAKQVFQSRQSEKLNSSRLAYKIMKFMMSVETETKFFDERMKAIVEMYAEKDEDGTPTQTITNGKPSIAISKEHIDECNKELVELYSIDVNPPDVKFAIDELDELKLSVEEMFKISPYL